MSIFFDTKDVVSVTDAPVAQAPATGFGENVAASFKQMRGVENSNARHAAVKAEYDAIMEDIRGQDRDDWKTANRFNRSLQSPFTPRGNFALTDPDDDEDALWAYVDARRAEDPAALPSTPQSREAMLDGALAKVRAIHDETSEIMDRSQGAGSVGKFVGGMGGAITDPVNVAFMASGGGSANIGRLMLREALLGGAAEAVTATQTAALYKDIGLDFTAGDFARRVGFGAAGGGLFAGGLRVLGKVPGAVRDASKSLSGLSSADLLKRFDHVMPKVDGDLAAARALVEADAEFLARNPFADDVDGINEYTAAARAADEDLMDGRPLDPVRDTDDLADDLATVAGRDDPDPAVIDREFEDLRLEDGDQLVIMDEVFEDGVAATRQVTLREAMEEIETDRAFLDELRNCGL